MTNPLKNHLKQQVEQAAALHNQTREELSYLPEITPEDVENLTNSMVDSWSMDIESTLAVDEFLKSEQWSQYNTNMQTLEEIFVDYMVAKVAPRTEETTH